MLLWWSLCLFFQIFAETLFPLSGCVDSTFVIFHPRFRHAVASDCQPQLNNMPQKFQAVFIITNVNRQHAPIELNITIDHQQHDQQSLLSNLVETRIVGE